MIDYVHPDDCDCYECVGSIIRWTESGHKMVENNLKHHTFGEPCSKCGREKSEYLDLGRKGYYVCWWCRERAAGAFGPEPAPPTFALPNSTHPNLQVSTKYIHS